MPPIIKPYVMTLDPGKKSGYALYDTAKDEIVSCGEDQFDPVCDWMEHYLSVLGPHTQVITEKFTITVKTARNSQAPWSLEMIGVARRYTHKYGAGDLHTQDAGSAKTFASNERLRELGWWQVGTEGHVNDALRHLMLFMASRGWWSDKLSV